MKKIIQKCTKTNSLREIVISKEIMNIVSLRQKIKLKKTSNKTKSYLKYIDDFLQEKVNIILSDKILTNTKDCFHHILTIDKLAERVSMYGNFIDNITF